MLIGISLRAELPQTPEFAQEHSDVRADPAVHFGALPNGLRYAVLANREPKQRASFRLLVLTGSAQEQENQLGLAHFIEHMAFKGTNHYAPGTLIKYFQGLGMSFGGDTNASTAFERTIYLLELPNTETKTVDEACQVFSDYARGELIIPHEIETERGVILSEKRDRDSIDYRQHVALENFLFGDTLLPKRLPIGSADIISHADASVFRDYYNQWYRAERMAVVAVGDFDPAVVEAEIKKQFAGLSDATPAKADPSLGQVPKLVGDRSLYWHDAEAGATTVVSYLVLPYSKENDTKAKRLHDLPRDLALTMINRRLAIIARKADAPFLEAEVAVDDQYNFERLAGFQINCRPEQWNAALTAGEVELRRALKFGFTAAELKEAVANERHELEEAVKTAATRRSHQLADHLVDSMLEGYVFSTPFEDLEIYKGALDRLTAEECMQALRAAFPETGHYVGVLGNAQLADKNGQAPESQILEVYHAAAASKIEPPAKGQDDAFAYTQFGAAGKVTAQQEVNDLGATLLTFSNGVRLNLKKTDFEANKIHLTIRVGEGQLTEPKNEPGLSLFADETFIQGGLGHHSLDDLIRLSAGRTIGLDFNVDKDALLFTGSTNREDLLFQLQVFAAYLTDAAYRPEALEVARKNFEPLYQKLEHTPEGALQLKVLRELASGDPRFGIPPRKDLLARTLEETKAWLEPQLKKGPIEIAVAGDLDPQATIDAVAQTLGSLSAREPKPALTAEREVHYPEKPFDDHLTVETQIPRGLLALFWATSDAHDVHVQRRNTLLAQVFADRLRVEVRDKLGDAYSPFARNNSSEIYPGYGFFMSYLEVDPAKAPAVAAAVQKIAADLYENGVTDEELTRAKQPVLTSLRESSRTNVYWLSVVLESAQEHPEHLDWSRSRYKDFESISKGEVDALAKTYFAPGKVSQVTVVPEKEQK